MTDDEIINSNVFKLINHMIDQHVSNLKYYSSSAARHYRDGEYSTISTRIYQEDKDTRGDINVSIDITNIDDILRSARNIGYHVESIRYLQRIKCELLNDYDFTHGDGILQKKIFGDERT